MQSRFENMMSGFDFKGRSGLLLFWKNTTVGNSWSLKLTSWLSNKDKKGLKYYRDNCSSRGEVGPETLAEADCFAAGLAAETMVPHEWTSRSPFQFLGQLVVPVYGLVGVIEFVTYDPEDDYRTDLDQINRLLRGTTRDELLLEEHRSDATSDSEAEAQTFVENVRKVSKASLLRLINLQKQVLSKNRLPFSFGIMLMLIMVFIHPYFDPMASSSNSSPPKIRVPNSTSSIQDSFKYDVFLSFRGEDTRKNFVGHIYEALTQKGIETYKDDEKIKKGEKINDQLLKSIEESRFFIIVFSKTYASSSWCLDELVKIIECQNKTTEQTAYPVFFDVEPTHVRKQNGPVGEAFSKHQNQEAAGKWRDAMKELADLAGWELKATANGDESKLIQIIVDAIFKKLHSTNSSTDGKLVGMKSRISNVLSSLETSTEDVRMIGIKGMGGAGKTTLARAVYDQISNHFEGKSFVENVREVSEPSLSGLKKLQKQILEDVLNKKDITVSSVYDGKNMLKATMRRRKILVVLDDVDRIEQLEALGEHDWFKSGSIVIITTRDEQVLRAHQVEFVHDVNLLSSMEALFLFSRYAFQKEIPIQGYEELSRQVVEYADGLPLTIKVLGSFLCGRDKLEWVDAIQRLKRIPLKQTLEKLELSYMSLEDEYKKIFLDIACILKGQHKQKAIRILESCGFHARTGLKVLADRSLITISKFEVLGMHDHIEEMGKNIVRRSHPNEPNKHSHLWIDEEIEDILTNGMGTEETRYLKLVMSRGNSRILMKGLGKLKKLRYLQIRWKSDGEYLGDDPKLDETTQYLPNSLKYLKCERYPFLYFPGKFQAKNLVGLEMKDSRMVQLWEEGEKKDLQKLKFLSLSNSELATFDFRITPNLEELYLENSYEFDLGLIPNLETLSPFIGTHFVKLKVPVECPDLKYLNFLKSRLRSLDLKLVPDLESLDLQYSDELVESNAPIGCLKRLNGIYVTVWCRLGKLPKDIDHVEFLEKLDLCSF